MSGLRLLEVEERADARAERDKAQRTLVDRLALASPAVALTRTLEGLAGRGSNAAAEFRAAVLGATAERVRLVLEQSLRTEPVTAEDFEVLVAATPTVHRSTAGFPARSLATLLVGSLALAIATALARRSRASSPEPASNARSQSSVAGA